MVDLLRAQVKHAMLGIGTVTQQDANYITVQFVNKTSRFAYPAAFETYLVLKIRILSMPSARK